MHDFVFHSNLPVSSSANEHTWLSIRQLLISGNAVVGLQALTLNATEDAFESITVGTITIPFPVEYDPYGRFKGSAWHESDDYFFHAYVYGPNLYTMRTTVIALHKFDGTNFTELYLDTAIPQQMYSFGWCGDYLIAKFNNVTSGDDYNPFVKMYKLDTTNDTFTEVIDGASALSTDYKLALTTNGNTTFFDGSIMYSLNQATGEIIKTRTFIFNDYTQLEPVEVTKGVLTTDLTCFLALPEGRFFQTDASVNTNLRNKSHPVGMYTGNFYFRFSSHAFELFDTKAHLYTILPGDSAQKIAHLEPDFVGENSDLTTKAVFAGQNLEYLVIYEEEFPYAKVYRSQRLSITREPVERAVASSVVVSDSTSCLASPGTGYINIGTRVKATGHVNTSIGTNIYVALTPPQPVLRAPLNNSSAAHRLIFKWEPVDCIDYRLQVATDIDFYNIVIDVITTESEYQIADMYYFKELYWRVRYRKGL